MRRLRLFMSDISTKWLSFVVGQLHGIMRATALVAPLALLGCSHYEQASMTIHAVESTGETMFRPPQPIWSFAITNNSSFQMLWESGVEVRGGDYSDYSRAGGHIDWPQGVLGPGETLFTNMIVPAVTG